MTASLSAETWRLSAEMKIPSAEVDKSWALSAEAWGPSEGDICLRSIVTSFHFMSLHCISFLSCHPTGRGAHEMRWNEIQTLIKHIDFRCLKSPQMIPISKNKSFFVDSKIIQKSSFRHKPSFWPYISLQNLSKCEVSKKVLDCLNISYQYLF